MNSKNERRAFLAGNDAPNTKMQIKPQNQSNRNIPKLQPPTINDAEKIARRELLESTRLSRLPPLPRRESFTHNDAPKPVVVAICAGCNVRLDLDDQIQQTFTGCRRCISIYSRLDAAFDENSKRKKKEILKKMAGGAR
jgi:hypothetical protein